MDENNFNKTQKKQFTKIAGAFQRKFSAGSEGSSKNAIKDKKKITFHRLREAKTRRAQPCLADDRAANMGELSEALCDIQKGAISITE